MARGGEEEQTTAARSTTDLASLPCLDGAGGGEEREAQRAILARPSLSIRLRVVVLSSVVLALMTAITIAAVVIVIEVRDRQALLEKLGNYSFEIQQARRFEKNFFLYETNLSDAVANVHTASVILERNAAELESAVGVGQYARMEESLANYRELLDGLVARPRGAATANDAGRREVEARLRAYGGQIVADAQELIDSERLAMHAMLHSTMVAAVAFLVLMFFVMAAITGFITRAVVRPLNRFARYAARVGKGDYTPISPARRYRDEFSDLALAFNQMLCELRVRQDQLVQSAKMVAVGSLTSGIAHELNNPLNNIGLTVEALLDDFAEYSDDEKQRMLDQVYTQVERASSTVRDLLDFTRKETPALVSLSLDEVVESTLKLVHNELNLGNVDLELDLPDDLPRVRGNPRNLQQVFLNLALNAIQAMPDGGTLSVTGSEDDGSVRVDVSDTGAGIPAEHVDRIFDPFFTTKEVGQGTGLGLFVCFSIVDKHGGRLAVESEPGVGTTFSVYLPFDNEA